MIHKPRAPLVLLINPWITDFAAYDLWAKPMGLLYLASLLREGGCGTVLIDCLNRRDPFTNSHPQVIAGKGQKVRDGQISEDAHSQTGALRRCSRGISTGTGSTPRAFRRELAQIEKPDIVWITSIMTYWYPGVSEAVRMVRDVFPSGPRMAGGHIREVVPRSRGALSGADRVVTEDLSRMPQMICELDRLFLEQCRRVGRFFFMAASGPGLTRTGARLRASSNQCRMSLQMPLLRLRKASAKAGKTRLPHHSGSDRMSPS